MIKKKNGKLVSYTFLLLILTIGFPFSALPTDSIFPEAEAQSFEEYTIRNQTSLTTMYSDTRGSVKMGLPEHILDNQGDWVANLFIEDSTGVQLESGTVSYFYDKVGCGMTQFETGRIISGETSPMIKSNSWAVKVAQNGTDVWGDITQNFLPCEVTTTISGDMITLNSTKSDSRGTITEIWDYTKYAGLKQTIWFTNNDTDYSDHKFHFSNIMLDTPKSFVLTSLNSTDNSTQANGYSLYPSGFIPPLMSDSTIILNVTSGETIQFDYNDMFLFNATTGNTTTITNSFTWIDKDQGFMNYDFDLAIDKLWSLKFIANTDNTLDVYVDYANVGDQTLAVGSTMMLDPTVQPPETDYMRTSSTASTATGGACGQGFGSTTIGGAFNVAVSGGKETCGNPVFKYDISAIPDTATPISMTYTIEVTANSDSAANSGFLNGGGFVRPIIEEDIFFASTFDIGDVIYNNGNAGAGALMLSSGNGFGNFNWHVSANDSLVGTLAITKLILSGTTNTLETQLESGKDFIIYVWCKNTSGGCSFGTNTASGGNSMSFDPNLTFLTVDFEQFAPPQAPQAPITATFTDTPDKCEIDWNAPLDTGGRPITGYQIERSTGASFQIIQATTGSSLPTDFTDTTIIAGTSNTYRISAITLEGVGVPSIDSNSCGVPVTSGDPFLQTLTNIGVGLVALDWLTPLFDGNDPITGYQIERTSGTPPPPPSDEWKAMVNKLGSSYADCFIFADKARIGLNILSCADGDGELAHYFFYKTFEADVIRDQSLSLSGSGRFQAFVGTCTGTTQVRVYDGAFDESDFADDSGGFELKGHGILQTFFTQNCQTGVNVNYSIDIVDVPFDISTFPNDNIDPSGDVTIVFEHFDTKTTAGLGNHIVMNTASISNVKSWDFTSGVFTTYTEDDPVACTFSCGTLLGGLITVLSDPQGFEIIEADTANTQTEFIDNTVTESTQFGYRVSAINSIGVGDPSNIIAILTAGAPDAPVITATATGTTTINVDWTTPDLNEGTLIEYQLERKITTGGIFLTLDSTTETFFNDGEGLFTLLTATEHCYQVKTVTNVGESSFSIESCATTFDAPSQVENLVVTALDGSSVNMSFDDPLNDGGSALTGFQIERQIGAGAFDILQLSTSFNKIRNDTGFPIGTLITYKVTPFNQFGGGDVAQASDTTDATPQAPQNFSCSASSASSITLNWDTPQTFSQPTGYLIDRRTIGGAFSTIIADTADTATQFVNQALPIDSTFEYRILGHTTEGDTDFTPTIRCTTLGAPDFPPEDLQGDFTSTVPHQMVLAWDIPDTFGVPIIEFRIERDDGAGYVELSTVSGNTFLFIDQFPDNDVDQKYRIFTVGSEGDSAPSIAIPFSANQTSHWHYEKTIDDTGGNKNIGAITGTANFNNTGQIGLGLLFDGLTFITVADESDYDFNNVDSSGFTTYYRGNSTGTSQAIISKSISIGGIGFNMFIDSTGVLGFRMTNTPTTNELHVLGSTNVTDNSLHFLGIGYNGNGTASGLSLMVDGVFETKNVIADTLSGSILNNDALTIGATSSGTNIITALLDETRIFGSGTLDDATLQAIAEDSITTVIPIVATITIAGSTFADISSETPLIIMTSGYPLPTINDINLFNFTVTNVNSQAVGLVIDGVSGQFILDPSLFNIMGSLSNYTATSSLTNSEEVFALLSNFDLQVPLFTFTGDFFFQQQRNDDFSILSFNYTQTIIPFDLDCNFKSTLFGNGTTVEFDDVFFVQLLQPVAQLEDVVVACIDPNQPIVDPSAPSFGGINTILSFVSFGDTTGVGNFLQFTQNYGDFFGIGLPFLFVIILAAAFTGRSAPTGILIIAIAIGIMSALGILEVDPFMWGIIVVLVILGVLGGKKFL